MSVYRKNIKIQAFLFIAFFFLGINVYINYLFADVAPWYNFIVLGLAVAFAVWIILLFRKDDRAIIELTPKEANEVRISLYLYFGVYVADIVLKSRETINQQVLSIVVAVVLSLIAIFGLVLHMRLLQKGQS